MGLKIPFGRKKPTTDAVRRHEASIPAHFRCPISLELMKDPVVLPTGITYDRRSIETWLQTTSTCPVTKQPLSPSDDLLVPNHSVRRMIQDWCVANPALGIERIPTPRAPFTSAQATELLSELASAVKKFDSIRCGKLVGKIKSLSKESERNRKCIASSGAGRVLAAAFGSFAAMPASCSTIGVKGDILSVLSIMLPLDKEAQWHIGSIQSLNSIVSVLRSGDLAGRLSAALVIRDLVSSSSERERINAVATADGLMEELVRLVREPISPQATKASLMAVFYIISVNLRTAAELVEMGLVPLLLEAMVDGDRSISEKCLGVLDALCSCEMGRERAYGHALSVPVVVKKMHRVSEAATGFAVSTLWKLCRNDKKKGAKRCVVREALQAGAFQKLLLLLQVGCSDETREKTTDLLKLLNGSRGEMECIEPMDYRGLKRPF